MFVGRSRRSARDSTCLGGPIAYGGVPAAQRQAGEVHLIRSAYLESESFRTLAEPADVIVDALLAELTQVTLRSVGGAGPVRFRAQAPARPAAIAYVLATEDKSNSTPRWWSLVSSAVFGAGALDYTQPDISGIPGFQSAWLQTRTSPSGSSARSRARGSSRIWWERPTFSRSIPTRRSPGC